MNNPQANGPQHAPKLPEHLRNKKRAICLAGGGPAAGLHIGVLKALQEKELEFNKPGDVWALSCIGAWVGIVYNQASKGEEIKETTRFFEDVFRNDASFKSFPANTVFTPDWAGNAEALWEFLLEPKHYRNAFLPKEIMKSFMHTMSALRGASTLRRRRRNYGGEEFEDEFDFKGFSEGDFNRWTLNDVLAVHPVTRFLTALIYKSKIKGLSRLYYSDSTFLNRINFDEVRKKEPFIYFNAWNLSRQELVLFANRVRHPAFTTKPRHKVAGYRLMDLLSLCACSALPFIEQTITINGDHYCEGALIDTVNFRNLLEDNDLDEIWISRLIDADQVLPPRNLYDSLANLCELFCATVGEDDVALFKYHLLCDDKAKKKWEKIKVVEIPVDCTIDFDWSHSNLKHGITAGEHAANRAYCEYLHKVDDPNQRIITPPDPEDEATRQKNRRERARRRLIEAGEVDA
jgi:predicted acylesterase/phospholipase RssA